LVPIGAGLSVAASATYDGERCDDPGYVGDCAIPVAAAMLWGMAAAVCVIAMVVVAEIAGDDGSRRLVA
jgi:hypothetical protein